MMRDSDDGVAQVIEFTASITILVIVLTVFFTAVGFQEGQYADTPPRPTGKALDATDYMMSSTGYLAGEGLNTTRWENPNLSFTTLENLTAFGLSTGEYGVLDYDKIVRMGELNWSLEYNFFYDMVRTFAGLSFTTYIGTSNQAQTYVYELNISVEYADGTPLMAWGYPSPSDPLDENYAIYIENDHTVITRIILIEEEGVRTPGFLTLDLIA